MLTHARSRFEPTTERDQLAQHFSRPLLRFLSEHLTAWLVISSPPPSSFLAGRIIIYTALSTGFRPDSFSDPTHNATLAQPTPNTAITWSSYGSALVVKAPMRTLMRVPIHDTTASKLKMGLLLVSRPSAINIVAVMRGTLSALWHSGGTSCVLHQSSQ